MVSGLREAEFDHIYPAGPTLFDRFLTYLDSIGVRETLEAFPDPRKRRSIPVRFLAQVLLVRPLLAVSSLAQLGPALSASPPVLHLLGFNAHQIEKGFRTNARQRPFDEETLANFAAEIRPEHCLAHCQAVLAKLIAAHPERFGGATVIVDSKGIYAPAGKANPKGERLPEVKLKACTLSLLTEGQALPLVWLLAEETEGEVTLGKALLEAVLSTLLEAGVSDLLLDAGYLDGAWLARLRREGLRVCIKVRQTMALYADALGAAWVPDVLRPRDPSPFVDAPPPKLKGKARPRRQVRLVTGLESWESAAEPLDALVIRDTYPDGEIREAVVACLGNTETDPLALLAHWRSRWSIEEFFMEADRYQKLGRLFPCRPGLARTWVHFAFLVHTLLWLFDHYVPEVPLPEPQAGGLLAISGPHFALLSLGRLLQIVFDHTEAWKAKRHQVLSRLGVEEAPP